jgi:molybdopterin-binding protein
MIRDNKSILRGDVLLIDKRDPTFLTADQAAALLHLNVKRVQALARSGQLPASRVGRKWLFRRETLLTRLGQSTPALREHDLVISARNHLWGRIVAVTMGDVMAEVRLAVGDQELVSVITRASAERLNLAVGDTVAAIIKSTEVMIAKA